MRTIMAWHRPKPMTILRHFEHMARDYHFCDRCCEQITPGEPYRGYILVSERGLFVYKEHANGCEFPPDPREEYGYGESTKEKEEEIAA